MKVVLISPYSEVLALGLRILSSCLKEEGFETQMIFLPSIEEMMVGTEYGERKIPAKAMQQIIELCADAGLVGLTLMTSSFDLARQISEAIHSTVSVPIIWGGIHPTVRPKECLQYADLVCIGEGEETIVELAQRIENGQEYRDVKNLAYLNEQGQVITNPLYPLISDLDTLPLPDYDIENHFLLHEDEVVPFSQDLMTYYLGDLGSWTKNSAMLGLLTTRGCPYRCSFCVNNTMVGIYDKWSKLRMRSPENVIAEIQAVRTQVPAIGTVFIRDDTFLANPKAYLNKFAQLYKEQVGLPFQAYTTARTVDYERLKILVDAGMTRIIMGVQTGSEKVQKIYKRDWATNEQILEATRLINQFQEQIPRPMYDIITDSPYETDEDRFMTLELVHSLPQPYKLSLFALTFYPGTEIESRAEADGLIGDQTHSIYDHNFQMVEPGYYNLALFCHHLNLPKPLLSLLVQRPIFDLFSWGILNKASGWIFSTIMALRLKSNERRYAKRRRKWLQHTQANHHYA